MPRTLVQRIGDLHQDSVYGVTIFDHAAVVEMSADHNNLSSNRGKWIGLTNMVLPFATRLIDGMELPVRQRANNDCRRFFSSGYAFKLRSDQLQSICVKWHAVP